MQLLKTYKIVIIVMVTLLTLITVLLFFFLESLKKMYNEFLNSEKAEQQNTKPVLGNSTTGLVGNQSPVTIVQTTGRYFLGKHIINLTNESIGNIYRLTNVPKGSTYCNIHLIECEVEYNQDGDYSNGSPVSNSQITIDSGALIEVFTMKVTSAVLPECKIYIEYYQ